MQSVQPLIPSFPWKAIFLVFVWTDGIAKEVSCHDQWPAWSPEGSRVAFVSTATGDHEIYTLDLATGHLEQLTDAPGRDAHPSFSPDAARIAFQSPREEDDTNLYVMSVHGRNVEKITDLEGFSGMPVWSPDGTKLAFQWRSPESGSKWQLMTVNLRNREITPLTNGSANDQVVNWAPDGSKLVFHSDRTGKDQLYVIQDGSTSQLTSTPYVDRSATWSPSGNEIAFISTRGEVSGVYITQAHGAATRRIGDIEVLHGVPFFSPGGDQLVVTPTGPAGTELWTIDVNTGIANQLLGACSARNGM